MAAADSGPVDQALTVFTDYFVRNYPGPNTVICDPNWHAPKIFRAAITAYEASRELPAASLGESHHCQNGRADICRASQRDGVICTEDSCDIDDGIRKPAPTPSTAGSGDETLCEMLLAASEDIDEMAKRVGASRFPSVEQLRGWKRMVDSVRAYLIKTRTPPTQPAAAQPDAVVGGDAVKRARLLLPILRNSAEYWGNHHCAGELRRAIELIEALLSARPAVEGERRPFAFCCAEGGGRIEGCSCVNKDHGFAIFNRKRPSVESLWQAFWATPHDEREWNRPTGTDGKPMPMTLISYKYEVVRAAFELDANRNPAAAEGAASESGEVVPVLHFDGDTVEAVVAHLLTAGYACDGDYEDFFMGVKNAMESAALDPTP